MMESFVKTDAAGHFPIQNLPYGVFSKQETDDRQIGVAIGDYVLSLPVLVQQGLIQDHNDALLKPILNDFMALGKSVWSATRKQLQELLVKGGLLENHPVRETALIPMSEVTMHLPMQIGDYTDFYCSREHATNVGVMFRGKDNALQPNWLHIPVGYHGRASSVAVSGTPVKRPAGQRLAKKGDTQPVFGASGWIVGTGNQLGEPISIGNAKDHIFGMVLLNDWSARDIQSWEYIPLGPFLGKSFLTTISPWIVTLEALEPFLVEGPRQDPTPLPYLRENGKTAYDIKLQVDMKPAQSDAFKTISVSNLKHMYWSVFQQLSHHTVNGCNMRPGDLGGTGTISGPTPDSYGSLLELTWSGAHPIPFDHQSRTFIEDGDEIKMTGWCEAEGIKIGFGECRGIVLPCTTCST